MLGDEFLHLGIADLLPAADRQVIVRGAVLLVAGEGALEHGAVPLLELFGQGVVELVAVLHGEVELVCGIGVRPEDKLVHQDLEHADHHRGEEPDHQHARADREADGRRDPDARRRRQAADQTLTLEDDTGAQEADAADHLGRHTGRVGAAGAGKRRAVGERQIHKAVFRDDHREGRAHADDHVRAHAGFLEVPAALHADGGAADAGEQKPEAEVNILLKIEISKEHVPDRQCVGQMHFHSPFPGKRIPPRSAGEAYSVRLI